MALPSWTLLDNMPVLWGIDVQLQREHAWAQEACLHTIYTSDFGNNVVGNFSTIVQVVLDSSILSDTFVWEA